MHSVSVSVHKASGVMPCLRMDGGVAGRATAYGGKEWQGVHFWGPQMKWFWRLKKAWTGTKCHGGRLPGRDGRCHGGRP